MKEQIAGWFAGRVPDGWFSGVPEVRVDHDEVLVVGPLSEPEVAGDAPDAAKAAARAGRIKQFREETRARRMQIAEEGEHRFGRKVSWGATCGDRRELFTTVSAPVMTRLRLPQREVLDTLVASGVARSRSDALNWCVRLVGQHQEEWISELRDALVHVEEVAGRGPATG
jgi:Arc/MetJ-type ribon-helix-helix transcriptional regulator